MMVKKIRRHYTSLSQTSFGGFDITVVSFSSYGSSLIPVEISDYSQPWGLNLILRKKGLCRSQSGFANHCAPNDSPTPPKEKPSVAGSSTVTGSRLGLTECLKAREHLVEN
ncbi:hypothetical protein PoB_007486900 [Plakobranchus ocellatus]|uniref:Uncharacterized protein n=1 Tax=Plakobranchus ocellatus TaxID=259542 RepID=A0AAV4DW91_9GAST|nr:hypothetical protein PoB_007486900 [Plakobranchus ocellatus]